MIGIDHHEATHLNSSKLTPKRGSNSNQNCYPINVFPNSFVHVHRQLILTGFYVFVPWLNKNKMICPKFSLMQNSVLRNSSNEILLLV